MVHIIIILILYLRESRLKWVICSRSYKLGSDKGMDLNPQVCLTPKCMFFFPVIKVRSFVRQASKTFASSGVLIINSVLSKYRTIPLQVLEKKKRKQNLTHKTKQTPPMIISVFHTKFHTLLKVQRIM